jgi:hypothetical protein
VNWIVQARIGGDTSTETPECVDFAEQLNIEPPMNDRSFGDAEGDNRTE